jgi:hypothetical protein
MNRITDPRLLAAGIALAAAAALFATTIARALDVEPARAAPSAPGVQPFEPILEEDVPPPAAPLGRDALLLAVEHDPFRPDRQRAPERYRLPGDYVPEPPPPVRPPDPPPPPPFRVVGTAISDAGGMAMIQVESATPRIVGIGESLLGYTLTRVTPDLVLMEGQGRTLSFGVVATQAVAAGQPGRPQPGRPGPATPADREAMMRQEMESVIEQLRRNGRDVPPALLQMIEQGMRGGRVLIESTVRGGPGGPGTQYQIRRDTMMSPHND